MSLLIDKRRQELVDAAREAPSDALFIKSKKVVKVYHNEKPSSPLAHWVERHDLQHKLKRGENTYFDFWNIRDLDDETTTLLDGKSLEDISDTFMCSWIKQYFNLSSNEYAQLFLEGNELFDSVDSLEEWAEEAEKFFQNID